MYVLGSFRLWHMTHGSWHSFLKYSGKYREIFCRGASTDENKKERAKYQSSDALESWQQKDLLFSSALHWAQFSTYLQINKLICTSVSVCSAWSQIYIYRSIDNFLTHYIENVPGGQHTSDAGRIVHSASKNHLEIPL